MLVGHGQRGAVAHTNSFQSASFFSCVVTVLDLFLGVSVLPVCSSAQSCGLLQCRGCHHSYSIYSTALQSPLARKLTVLLLSHRFLFSQWQLAKRNMKAAVYKRFSYLAGKCFFAWSNYVYMVALGLDRKRWPGPRKYEVRFVTARWFVGVCAVVRATRVVFDTRCSSWQCGAWRLLLKA
jgi:hypothetical protein